MPRASQLPFVSSEFAPRVPIRIAHFCSIDEGFYLGQVLAPPVVVSAGARLGIHARRAHPSNRVGDVVRAQPAGQYHRAIDLSDDLGTDVPVVQVTSRA